MDNQLILIAEDDKEYRILLKEAFLENHFEMPIQFVKDGEELMAYLNQEGEFKGAPEPDLIFLDLNLPRKDGREVLKEIKTSDKFKRIPVVVFSTSNADFDVISCYDAGANGYITKPHTFSELVETIRAFGDFWFKIAILPHRVTST